jgi:cyclophilin family peptidyl-prolyl cis-trans isomerase
MLFKTRPMKNLILALALLFSLHGVAAAKAGPRGKVEVVVIKTSLGEMVILLSDKTPKHRDNFLKLAKEHYYDGTTFHRVITGFMIQGGDPNSKDTDPGNDGQGGPGYTIPAEFDTSLSHNQGALAAARMGDQVNPNRESSGSQFYIVENKAGAHFLDRQYTVFGQVISGLDVPEKIAQQPKNGQDRPLQDVKMTVEVVKMKRKKVAEKYGYTFPE